MKALYIVLSGSKKTIEENEEKIVDYLKTFKRKIGNNEVRSATVCREILMDTEHNTGSTFTLDDFPKIAWYLKGYRAVILKYTHYGKRGTVHTRGRRWRFSKKLGKEIYK